MSRPTFFNSKKADPSQQTEGQQSQVKQVSSSASLGYEAKIQKKESNASTGGFLKNTSEEQKDESLTREAKQNNTQLPEYTVVDGAFESFPEIGRKTIDKLKA